MLMTDTCINYQTIMPPVRGEHLRFWRYRRRDLLEQCLWRALEFRRRPSALSAGLTGRTPRYGYHLDERRRRRSSSKCLSRPES